MGIVVVAICFFFKQKTAYEMRISDWSSDVCSSDLEAKVTLVKVEDKPGVAARVFGPLADASINVDMIIQNLSDDGKSTDITFTVQIGRASCRERVCQYV